MSTKRLSQCLWVVTPHLCITCHRILACACLEFRYWDNSCAALTIFPRLQKLLFAPQKYLKWNHPCVSYQINCPFLEQNSSTAFSCQNLLPVWCFLLSTCKLLLLHWRENFVRIIQMFKRCRVLKCPYAASYDTWTYKKRHVLLDFEPFSPRMNFLVIRI